MRKKGNYIILWSAYFDKKLSRSQGRRVPLRFSVENPSLTEIDKAARKLGFKTIVEPNKRYPKDWWNYKGRILIEVGKEKLKKTLILKKIGKILKEFKVQ
ncbi:MAG: signal recognition particle subunit SRP19/SEC65 family protein [Candidatus Odinarchaeota archaeon]|nr:signal recognition particle subunit SRP19/SEC65 family protein [Candidatus Odinarchaeota archaeon]